MRQQRLSQYALVYCFPALYIWGSVSTNASVVHYLPLDGSTPVDVVGGATITNFGAEPTADRNGVDSSAYEFDGWTDYIQADINVNFDAMPTLTWGAWIQSDISHQDITVRAVASQDDGGFDRQFGIDYRSGNGISAFKGDGVLGSYSQNVESWYFVATTYNEIDHRVKLYVAEQSNTSPTGFTVIAGTLANVDNGHDYIYLGANPFAFVAEHWDGAIDNFFVVDEVLTLEELSYIATHGIVIPEPTILSLCTLATLILGRRQR